MDAVWHLHLLFTESYWNVLCGEILGRPLHHRPGTGRPGEASDFEARYLGTLADYAAEFGREPPAEVWPRPVPSDANPVPTPSRRRSLLSILTSLAPHSAHGTENPR